MYRKTRPCKSLIDFHPAGFFLNYSLRLRVFDKEFRFLYFYFFPRLSLTEATYRHHLVIDGQYVSLDIMDTAGKVRLIFFIAVSFKVFSVFGWC